jgi:hypothetical protein
MSQETEVALAKTFITNLSNTATISLRIEDSKPTEYRLAKMEGGHLVLQGGHFWKDGRDCGIVWRDIPLVSYETGEQLT